MRERARIHHSRRGFTIAELLVVIAIIVLLLGVAAGSLRGLLRSSERSLAEQQLRLALGAARDLALRSDSDAGAFFVFDGRRIKIVPAVSIARIEDLVIDKNGAPVAGAAGGRPVREIFAPSFATAAAVLPAGFSVRGFASAGSMGAGVGGGLYDCDLSMDAGVVGNGHWVFPETSFVDLSGATAATIGGRRQSFFVRFEAKTGNLVASDPRAALLLDVLNTDTFRGTAPYTTRLDEADEVEVFVRRTIADASLNPAGSATPTPAQQLLGDASPDTVLCVPVTELALYSERSMANAIGARRLNRDTDTIYTQGEEPAIDATLFASAVGPDEVQARINNWINITPNAPTGTVAQNVIFDARVFTLSRALGQVQEVRP